MKKTNIENGEVFSRNLQRHLKMSKTKQVDIAKAIGVSPSTITDWLKERTYPRMDKVQLLAEYFGIQKSELLEDVYVAKETVTEEDQKVLDLFHKVPQEKRAAAIALCEAVLNNLSKF